MDANKDNGTRYEIVRNVVQGNGNTVGSALY